MLTVVLVLHAVLGATVLVAGRRLPRAVFALAGAPMLAAVVLVAAGALDDESWKWVPSLGLRATFELDGFAVLMALVVSVIGVVVMAYSAAYFAGHPDQARTRRFAGYLCWFSGAMFGLVVAGDVWTLFTFWELTSVLSFLLIGLDDAAASTRAAAQRALLVTAAGGLAMLGGLACLVRVSGSAELGTLLSGLDDRPLTHVGLALVLVGALTKSAQFPFHFWLPGAMAAPTPVSAYLHSATMVKAGVVLVARFAPAVVAASGFGWWRPLLVCVGTVTTLLGGVAALRGDDAKQALAFGTVSQLGLLMLLVGFGEPAVTAAGVCLLAAHAVFKCGLFLAVGAVDHATGTRSLSANSGVGRELPWLAAAAGLCTLSMLGFPLTFGFAAKESALAALDEASGGWAVAALAGVVAGAVLTSAYSLRLWWGLFATKPDGGTAHVHAPSPLLAFPVYVFGALSLVLGLLAGPVAERLTKATEALDHNAHAHLAVWPGLHVPLLLSVGAIVLGAVLARAVIVSPPPAPEITRGERAFGRAHTGLLDGARSITRITQSGSLPAYVAVVFSVLAVAVGCGLAFGVGDGADPVLADSVAQGLVAALGVIVAAGVVAVRRRFVAVLLLGGVGQSVTVLFLLWGAPDLALTQFLVESMSIVAFLLVLRRLPQEHRAAPSWAPKALRLTIAVAVGVAVSAVALAAGSLDRPTDTTDAIAARALPEAGGRNLVNVTIVDFRGVDTLFEITVFATAALGVANLVAASEGVRRPRTERRARVGAQSLVLEQTTRMVFHLTLLVSLYVTLRGHNAPGGGFAGGLIAGAAFVFRVLAGDDVGPRRRVRIGVPPLGLVALGLLLALGSGVGGLIAGGEFLETSVWDLHLPGVGDVHLPTAGFFDLGVYSLVVGVVILVLGNLAGRAEVRR